MREKDVIEPVSIVSNMITISRGFIVLEEIVSSGMLKWNAHANYNTYFSRVGWIKTNPV